MYMQIYLRKDAPREQDSMQHALLERFLEVLRQEGHSMLKVTDVKLTAETNEESQEGKQ